MQYGDDKFTWEVENAGETWNEPELKGETSYLRFIQEFERFPWAAQIETANSNEGSCSPTLSIRDMKSEKTLWISGIGDNKKIEYIIGYTFHIQKRRFFGLGKFMSVPFEDTFITSDSEAVKKCIKLFFERQYEELDPLIRQLDEFGVRPKLW